MHNIYNEILFQNAPDGILIHDEHGVIYKVNNASLTNLGYNEQEIQSLTIFDIEIGANREQLLALWQSCSIDVPVSVNGTQRRKDGSTFPVEVNISSYFFEDKKYLLAIARDVSQRKQVEDELQLYSSMIESTSDPMYVIDSETSRMLYVNEAAVKHYGVPREEILTWRIPDWDPNFVEQDLRPHIEEIRNNPGTIIESQHKVHGSRIVPVEVSLNVTEYKGRTCHFGFIHNISERKKAEEKQAEINQQLKYHADQLAFQKQALDEHAIVSIADVKGNIIYVNEKFENITQYSEEEVLGKNHRILKSDFHSDDFYKEMLKTIANGKTWQGEIKNKAKDGTDYWVKSTIVPLLNEKGKPEQYIAIRTDISYIKDLEGQQEKINQDLLKAKEIAEKEKEMAEKANQAKSEFLSSMSHELRTPLNAIFGFSQLLESDSETPLTMDQKESVDHILSGARHLLTLINEVLELSVIESGHLQLSMEPVQVNNIINESVTLLNSLAEKTNIELHVLSDSAVLVHADNTKLKQVLLNLVSNAIKYNKKGGSVSIESHVTENKSVKINISDTGIGISEANQQKVFSPFNRFGQELSSIEGTGIGLLVTKDLVELMGGSIGFESKENRGSTFWIELPLTEQDSRLQSTLSTTDAVKTSGNGREEGVTVTKRVLYVEDNPANRQLMDAYFLRHKDIILYTAETGELAWDMMSEYDFDLVLMDIHLPGMDGKELTRYIKNKPEYEHMPIIAVTAAAMAHDIESAEDLFASYITKPIDFSDLDEQIKKHLPVG
ncbi:MAG: PAS domain S-box protein [Gammaproteobacteria bacterium]|nr:PAS domain S-box protein [Gammaproteobacteria bacterium]